MYKKFLRISSIVWLALVIMPQFSKCNASGWYDQEDCRCMMCSKCQHRRNAASFAASEGRTYTKIRPVSDFTSLTSPELSSYCRAREREMAREARCMTATPTKVEPSTTFPGAGSIPYSMAPYPGYSSGGTYASHGPRTISGTPGLSDADMIVIWDIMSNGENPTSFGFTQKQVDKAME